MKKTRNAKVKLILMAALLAVPACFAFDINTHTAMTAEAIRQSRISDNPNSSIIFQKLGLFDRNGAIGSYYIDIGANGWTKRSTTAFESKVIDAVSAPGTGLVVPNAESIPGWIIRGAIREDDNITETPQGTPQGDEPGGVFNRVFGHFLIRSITAG